jgi:hypothetical protein
MATHCSNKLTIYGNRKQLIRFILDHTIDEIDEENDYTSILEEIEDNEYNPLMFQKEQRLSQLYPDKNYTLHYDDLHSEDVVPDFSVLLPTPREKNDYYWRVDKWGTEANSTDFEVEFDSIGNKLYIEFNTLWTPPKEWVVYASEYYSGLTFEMTYYSDIREENSSKIWGSIKCSDGEIVEENDYLEEELLEHVKGILIKIKNLPSQNPYPISDYIALFESIKWLSDESIEIEDIAEELEALCENITRDQLNIMNQIADMWTEKINSTDAETYDLNAMFYDAIGDIIQHYMNFNDKL